VRAAFGIGSEDPNEEGFDGFRFAGCGNGDIEGDPAGVQVLGAVAIGKEAIMPDALKALGEHVEQKPTDNRFARSKTERVSARRGCAREGAHQLLDREAHHLHFVAMSVAYA